MKRCVRTSARVDATDGCTVQFPAYMKENDSKLSKTDKERYQAQIASITKIMTVFDDPTYKDEDPEKSAEIVSLMSEVRGLDFSAHHRHANVKLDANAWLATRRTDGTSSSWSEPGR